MSLVHVGNMGGQNYRADVELAAVSVTKDTLLYNVSGYASNATIGNAKTHNIIGVVQNTVDNSGGSVGDKVAVIEMSPLALYEATTTGTLAVDQRWTNVTMESVSAIDEDDGSDTDTGIAKIRAMLSTSKALISLNFASPADA